MTCTPRVWGDVLRRLQEEIPDFAFDAWIAPLAVKIVDGSLVLGCPTSFHRDRVRIHFADPLERCLTAALDTAGVDSTSASPGEPRIQILTTRELDALPGLALEVERTSERSALRKVEVAEPGRAASAFGGCSSSAPSATSVSASAPAAASLPEPALRPSGADVPRSPVVESTEAFALHAVPETTRAKARVPAARTSSSPSQGGNRKRPASTSAPSQAASSDRPIQRELPFSFESFIVGPCNALAREAALALARERQRTLNQLYLGGDSGMGKTHLARATAAEARRHGSSGALHHSPAGPGGSRGIVYTSAEQFTSEFVSAVRGGRSEDFKRRYRAPIGLLVIEDVQFFSGRAQTQLELFHTMQHVLDAGGRVLVTGDRPPRELTGLDDRIRAQLGRGFVAELEPPDALVRRHILRAKAAAGGVALPEDCLDLLVEATEGSVRDIESVLIQVVTTSSLLGHPIDLDLTRDAIALKTATSTRLAPRAIAVTEIVRTVSAFFGKRPETLASRSRRRDVLVPRQLAMYLAHRYTDASFTEIGRALGRDHPSVRNAIQRVERQVLENAPLRYQVEALSERIDQSLKRAGNGGSEEPKA